jgi:hypothetical protein
MSIDHSKLILGFDGWTAGSHHFARLVPALEDRGYRLMLLHIGSWGHDKGRLTEETISGMLVRDISFYQGKGFDQIIEQENPAGVLFLSVRSLAHMAFLRYAMHKRIPSCHLYHGLVRVQAVDIGQGQAYRPNPVSQVGLIIERSVKNISILIPAYVRSLVRTQASIQDWFTLAVMLAEKAIGQLIWSYLPGTETSIGCVYTSADTPHMKSNYHIPENKISVVGNPDLIAFGLEQADLAAAFDSRAEMSGEVIYIDTALVRCGMVFSSDQDFINYLLTIRDGLGSQGYRFVAKLHPAHLHTELPEQIISQGIELCDSHEFKGRLLQAAAVITEPSSAAMIPALLGVPLFLSNLGPLAGQKYGEVLTSHPMARFLYDLADFDAQLAGINRGTTRQSVLDWIKENSGPLPASEMPARVAEVIDQMVRKQACSCAD